MMTTLAWVVFGIDDVPEGRLEGTYCSAQSRHSGELCKIRNPALHNRSRPAWRNIVARRRRTGHACPGILLPKPPLRAALRDEGLLFDRSVHVHVRLDAIDRKILAELQDNGRMTNVELSSRVGISPPPCLRRVRALEEAGYIKGYRALLDEKKLGYEVSVFAMVNLARQAESDLMAFEDFVRAQPLVRECWMLSGEIDFVLKCVAPDLKTFQAFVEKLTSAPNVRNVKTSLVLRNSKDAAMVPMED